MNRMQEVLDTLHAWADRKTQVVGGVIDANSCGEWIWEEISESFDLGYAEHLKENPKCARDPSNCMCDVGGRVLLGDWKRTWEWLLNGRAVPAHTPNAKRHMIWVEIEYGPKGYAALYNKDGYTIQVVWSKWVKQDCRDCSPCYPNQGDLNSSGGITKAYQLPPELSRCLERDGDRHIDIVKVVYCPNDGHMRCSYCCDVDGYHFETGEKYGIPQR